MTAEVAVMNKLAVAMAADSAVTYSMPQGQKIYNAANKLFSLSKSQPIGVMVYGNAEILDVPWETVIKVYRQQLGSKRFSRVKDYFDDLLSFLDRNDGLFPADAQLVYAKREVMTYYRILRDRIIRHAGERIHTQAEVTDEEIEQITDEVIEAAEENLDKFDYSAGYDATTEQVIGAQYRSAIDSIITEAFPKLPITEARRAKLAHVGVLLLARSINSRSQSGVVVAGFGEDEFVPSLWSANVHGRLANRLKYNLDQALDVADTAGGAIVPFAQRDAVEGFMGGVDPAYQEIVSGYLEELFQEFPKRIMATIGEGVDPTIQANFIGRWQAVGHDLLQAFQNRVDDHIRRTYIDPILRVVEAVPKGELAALAEALVSLTSLKRKVSADAETVGGPIDVVVISKGDGLIWIQRKHYFKPELNHQFFANYFPRSSREEVTDDGVPEAGGDIDERR